MSDPMLVALFLFIVFAPCLFACIALADKSKAEPLCEGNENRFRSAGHMAAPFQAGRPESAVCEEFEIRSFAKGISQHRLVIRDTGDGTRLTIAQLRAAAAELLKLGGMIAVRQLAHAVAASAAAMTAVQDAFAVAAKNAYEWFDWDRVYERAEAPLRNGPSLMPPHKLVARWQQGVQQAA